MIVTEQSHVLNCRMFCILISKVILSIFMTSCCFCFVTVVLMPFVAFCSGLVWLISVCLVTV